MRNPRWYRRRWKPISILRQEQYIDLIRDNPGTLDEKFFADVRKRVFDLMKAAIKLTGLQLPIFLFLVLSLLPIHVNFSILGITPAANRTLRELLVVASSVLAIASIVVNLHRTILEDMLKANADRLSKGDAKIRETLRLGWGIDLFTAPSHPTNWDRYAPSFGVALGVLVVVLFVVVGIIILAGFAVHVLVLRDIYVDPTFSRAVSLLVIAFVLLCDVLVFCLALLQAGFVPVHDFGPLREMDKISKSTPDRALRIHRHIVQEHSKRTWLMRLIARPRIPKDLSTIK